MSADLVGWLRGCLDEDEKAAQSLMRLAQDTQIEYKDHLKWLGRETPGWWAWPDVEAMCGQRLAEVTPKRVILDLHRAEPLWTTHPRWEPDTPAEQCCRCIRGHYRELWPCDTVLAVAQPYQGRDGWRDEWGTE